jgi:hypothetical protein
MRAKWRYESNVESLVTQCRIEIIRNGETTGILMAQVHFLRQRNLFRTSSVAGGIHGITKTVS